MRPEEYDIKMDDLATEHPNIEIRDAERKGLILIERVNGQELPRI